MKKMVSVILSASMLFGSIGVFSVSAASQDDGNITLMSDPEVSQDVHFTHQNVVGSQTCYTSDNDKEEKTVEKIPNVYQGMRINQPVFRAYLGSDCADNTFTVKQKLKDGTVIKTDEIKATAAGVVEFKHARNCETIEILSGDTVVATLGAEPEYVNGVAVTKSPMSYQIYQRDENDKATITITGKVSDASSISVVVGNNTAENAEIENDEFTYTKELGTGLYDITVTSDKGEVAKYEKVGVGDVWVAAGQSNMTDMGAICDGFDADNDDPINENMHIIYPENCEWSEMSHPAGEGRFFKTGVRTSPITSFAREIAASEHVPVGIVQSSVGGTNMWQWFDGIRNDSASGYLFNALKSCFDKMPSHDVKGILWYQGCNDTDTSSYAYDYKNLQQKAFDNFHNFFGEDVPIITTQLNDANQDTVYNEWSFVKDIQRQNAELYDNVYVVGTGELELGDTIHNSAPSNVKLGKKWANVAKAVVYGDNTIKYRNAQIDTVRVTGNKELTVTFKDTDGLKVATGTKRLGITNVSGGGYKIELGDLKKEFRVRKGAKENPALGTGTVLTIASAELQSDGKTVVITTEEDFAGRIAVDCMYGKRFVPSLVDAATNESVLSFYNVIAYDENAPEIIEPDEYIAAQTANLTGYADLAAASDEIMYVNYWKSGSTDNTGYGLMKFTLGSIDLSKIASAKLAVYATKEASRSGNVTVSEINTDGWDSNSTYNDPAYADIKIADINTVSGTTASVFPLNDYSSIDITEYMRKFSGTEIGIALSSNYASDTTLAGINSEHPPKLIIEQGRKVDLTYTCGGEPCANIGVTIEGTGYTEYDAKKFTTDENGELTLYLANGSYKAVTEKETYKIEDGNGYYYEPSENAFDVSADAAKSYTLTSGSDAVAENPTYTFGDSYNEIKEFNTQSLSETKIGDTGLKISTSSSNYNNVAIMSNQTKSGGYYPYGNGLADNGYYLFLGSGGNGNVNATLKFDNPIPNGKYIKITYAKPQVTNNGSSNRTAANAHTITAGSESIDIIDMGLENDKWYTTTVMADNDISQMDITLGKWAAIAISKIEITDTADTMELSAEADEAYISDGAKVQFAAKLYKSITTLMGSDEIIAKGTAVDAADITYSVNGYTGVSIDNKGSLSITSSAPAGTVTVSAECGGVTKSVELLLKSLGNADTVEIYGDEVIIAGNSTNYKAIPLTNGIVVPERLTRWEIVGEANGTSISEDGTLTVPENAAAGVIMLKATLLEEGAQPVETSAVFPVTIRTASSAVSPYEIQGIFLKNGETDLTKATGIEGLIINKTAATGSDYVAVVKVFDKNDKLIAEKSASLNGLSEGVSELNISLDFEKASKIKSYITEAGAAEDEEITKDFEIEVLGGGNNITRINVNKKTEGEQEASLMIAQYANGALTKLDVADNITLNQGKNVIPDSAATLDNGMVFKVMLWDSMESMKPLAEAANQFAVKEFTSGAVVSDEVFTTTEGSYKNVPLVSDWITGTNSGLGMGAGIISPSGAPYGVDPALVNLTANISYSYGADYEGADVDNALWYKTGAYTKDVSIYARDGADWEQQALPIGNGYMGAMLFGMPQKDQIQFNEETFWAAGYRGVQSPVASNNVNKNMSEGINGYMSVGNVFVDFTDIPNDAAIKNYYRDLNLDDSVAHVRYEYDDKAYSREYFASYPKQVLVFRYEGDGLNFDVNPVSMHPGNVTVKDGEITIIGRLKDSEPYSSGGNAAWNQTSDLEYCTKVKVIADDGIVTDGYNTVTVKGATGVTILVAAATDYDKDEFDTSVSGKVQYKSTRGVQAAIDKATARINGAANMSYDELKAEHIADYKAQFDTVKFSLTDENEVYDKPTNELVSSYSSAMTAFSANNTTDNFTITYDDAKYQALSHHLEELHYNYARYMMISSSRSDTMPANLQGKWCQSTAEIWGSCYCININMEMNYWFAGGANLLDSGKALVGWFNSQIPAGTVTAKNMYGVTPKSYTYANGKITFADSNDDKDDVFIMHTKQAIMGTTDMTGSTSIQSAGNTAWLMYNLWDLYQTTGDKELLERELYPIMRKAANFYTQYLYTKERKTTTDTETYPDGYYYTTWEGRSPEQGPNGEGIKYDLQLVAGMYDYTIAAAETLGVDAEKVAAWKEIRNHLEIPVELGEDGQIKEWKQEVKYNRDASGNALGGDYHRHISHLVGLYPGNLINRDTPELLEGAKIVLTNRGDGATGWSTSNKFLLWARTLEGDKALDLFRFQLAHRTYANLFDYHSPFQIDGNFGSAAGVMELLMQSHTGPIYILPALPTLWDKGEISGIKAKNGAEIAIKWEDNQATEFTITPANNGDITIGYDKEHTNFKVNDDVVNFTGDIYTIKNAVAGQSYTFVPTSELP